MVLRRHRIRLLGALIVAIAGLGALAARGIATPTAASESSSVADFVLLDHTGRFHQLSRYATARAVVLYAHDFACAASREGLVALQEVQRGPDGRNVVFLAIDANPRDDRATLAREASKMGLDVPIVHDDGQLVTEGLQVSRSGEAIVVEPKSWRIVYRGPVERDARPGGRDLVKALTAFLEGRSVPGDLRPAPEGGCPVARDDRLAREPRSVSYASDVVPILRAKCVACHRRGGIGPWAMDGYERIKTWSPRIRAALLTGRMPPWHADPAIGAFTNDRSLSVEQKRTLVRWIDGGVPRGTEADPLATKPPPPADEWPLGKPDVVIELPHEEIPATGTLDYRYVEIPAPVSRDTWVRAIHLAPRNPAAMHHAALFLAYPVVWQHRQPQWHGGAAGFFGAYAPGLQPVPFPADSGGFLPAGSSLVFQLHYTTSGQAATDRPRAALYFHRKPPALEARVVSGVNVEFVIPPNADDYPVEASYVFESPVTLQGFLPHMHYRGKRFRYEAHYPDGRREVLLSVPRYDFNWQTYYALKTPKPIPAQTRIVMTGAFDNSARNPANPDASKEVRWGHQSWDEMFVGYMMYTAPRPPARSSAVPR